VTPLQRIGERLETLAGGAARPADVAEMLRLGEDTLAHWVTARGEQPTRRQREGFRLLALHRQGAQGEPSFNACRETCRELAYHYNLIGHCAADVAEQQRHATMMALLANHLFLFVSGKMEARQLGEFCCSSRPLRAGAS
jgi:hypothetical protein